MKKTLTIALLALFVGAQALYGAEGDKVLTSKESVSQPVLSKEDTKEAAKRAAEADKRLIEERKKVEVSKKDLNGTRWEVTVKPGDPKEKESSDVLTFQDHQYRSEYLEKKGYPSTNYTITVPQVEGQAAVWETMKTGQAGVAFVRGEWSKDVMTGVIQEQVVKGKDTLNKQYYFTSLKRVAIAPSAIEEKAAKDKKGDSATSEDVVTSQKDESPKVLKSLEKKN